MDFPADFVGSKARNHRQSGDWQGFAMQSNGRTCRKDMRNILLIQAISIICSGVKIMVRIISGARRGKKLLAPQGEQVRPTTNMVKEALFNILFRYGIADSRFLAESQALPEKAGRPPGLRAGQRWWPRTLPGISEESGACLT